ncbi:Protein of unknown function [Ruminococcus sp. YE71]|uniref:DUF3089 domain-containing protein n=1 Tax=unclassified Ruminococcus TaxID=2608920 RepID=UPI00088C784A|nr:MULTISPECIES: DUF3089 domain-containing protein [unclassified Ruminococcus]SDA23231.1 Protein of unknown function [Ruminococcus sp. YE78]SFW39453.1 Protein of unknown function [Ruminococcus sp. YE71]
MKRKLTALLLALMCLCTSACAEAQSGQADASAESSQSSAAADVTEISDTDYSDHSNWAYYAEGENKDADLFLVCPTVDTKDEANMSLDDEETKRSFVGALNMERGIYEDSTRMFAPYYRQAAMSSFLAEEDVRDSRLELAYSDVSAAFAYYLEHENNGRPVIIAGFSQGSDMCYRLVREYFGDEELRDRLIAVYTIGLAVTEEEIADCPQLRPAQSADDLGVFISFECESPDVQETMLIPRGRRMLSINPLTWSTDTAPADKSLNKGACFTSYSGGIKREESALCGCYIDEERGTLKVTDIDPADYPSIVPGLPEGAYHIYDYQFFFRNLQENVQTRLAAYLAQRSSAAA